VIHLTVLDLAAIAAELGDTGAEVVVDWDQATEALLASAALDDPIQSAAALLHSMIAEPRLAFLATLQLLSLNGLEAEAEEPAVTRQRLSEVAGGGSREQTEAWLDRITMGSRRQTAEELEGVLRRYLTAIATSPLLSIDEEAALARRVRRGRDALDRLHRLSPDQRKALEPIARDGLAASRDLTQSNLRLVVSIAKKLRTGGEPLMPIIQRGNLGLMEAVEKYDPDCGSRFAVYAAWWIRRAISKSQSHGQGELA
jgi:DNA-directed RNA polymerase sigma subunit (sigma70/sigma32)